MTEMWLWDWLILICVSILSYRVGLASGRIEIAEMILERRERGGRSGR